jgi:hypothetical protein
MDRHREVGWSDLTIYEFRNIVGDHPGLTGGAPLTIDWKHVSEQTMALDCFECYRETSKPRRPRSELKIPASERDIL